MISRRAAMRLVGSVTLLISISIAVAVLTDSDSRIVDLSGVDTSGVDGANVFATSCAQCHGTGLRGTNTGPPLLNDIYRSAHHPDAAIISAILIGSRQHHWSFGAMAPIAGLDESQIAAVITFIREQQRIVGIE